MPIMPLRESLRGNLDGKTREESHKKRKRRSESTEKHKDKSRSPHNKGNSRSPKRKCRNYRGSSGTRTQQRSVDRAIRLKEYAKQKKCDHPDRKDTASGSRHEDSNYKCSSTRTSSNRNTSPHNNRSCRSSPASGSVSKTTNNNNHHESSKSVVLSDEDGHLIYRSGDWLQNRYKIHKLLGVGTFGKCFECYDKKHDRIVALKIIRNKKKYREAAKLEIDTLKKLTRKDPDNKYFCIQLYGWFTYHGHVCIAFPILGKSVFDFMKENLFHPYPSSHVQQIAHQLLVSVKFLHSLKLTHTDLKPENMMFVDSSYTSYWSDNAISASGLDKERQDIRVLKNPDMKLIDFGSATFDYEYHSTIVSTRHYRAPEVVLQLGWSQPCDLWSCGCIIFELFTGNTLFQTHDDLEHLAMMERSIGTIPTSMIQKTRLKYFANDRLNWDTRSKDGRYVKANCRPLKEHIMADDRRSNRPLYELLKLLLEYDPKKRITASQALEHPYFTRKK